MCISGGTRTEGVKTSSTSGEKVEESIETGGNLSSVDPNMGDISLGLVKFLSSDKGGADSVEANAIAVHFIVGFPVVPGGHMHTGR